MQETDFILIAEDDEVDKKSIKRAFNELKIINPLSIVDNGKEALNHLQSPDIPNPCLILLDLNMPQMNGIEFLQTIRSDDKYKKIPVVVLTTSQEEKDLVESYNLGVSGYMLKPVDYKQFVEVVRTIHLYWLLSLTPPLTSK